MMHMQDGKSHSSRHSLMDATQQRAIKNLKRHNHTLETHTHGGTKQNQNMNRRIKTKLMGPGPGFEPGSTGSTGPHANQTTLPRRVVCFVGLFKVFFSWVLVFGCYGGCCVVRMVFSGLVVAMFVGLC